jgi:sterol desaturase/sphingolipid hydroxylase (fatty acid hydroxylase superfamily)
MINVVKIAIPFFFVMMALEILILWKKGKINYYRITDTINDLSCGVSQQVADIFMKLILFGIGYQWVYEHWSIPILTGVHYIHKDFWLTWVIVFIAADFVYYWFHRHSHEIALFWSAHVVHHQSEEYNLAVALRQSIFQQFFSWFYYLIFAFAGVPFEMWFICMGINLIYQFWIHTRAVGKLGFLEIFMNTPSHHRVHHGKDPKYCDKNHAGVFIIWDKMFGTFQEEEEEPTYGITVPLNSWNPLWANIGGLNWLLGEAIKAKGLKNKLKILFGKPGWRPNELGGSIEPVKIDKNNYLKYETFLPNSTIYYLVFHFLITLLFSTQLLELSTDFLNKPLEIQLTVIGASFLVLFSLTNLGGIMEKKNWAYSSEIIRIFTISAGILGLSNQYISFYYLLAFSILWAISQYYWFKWVWKHHDVHIQYSTPYPFPSQSN